MSSLLTLLLVNKNKCADVASNPASTLVRVEDAIETIRQVKDGFLYLRHARTVKDEIDACIHIECQLLKVKEHLIEIGANHDS